MKHEIKSYETGRHYNGAQVLRYKIVDFQIDADDADMAEWGFGWLTVLMVDDSRDLQYKLRFYRDRESIRPDEVLAAYDQGGNDIAMTTELIEAGLIVNNADEYAHGPIEAQVEHAKQILSCDADFATDVVREIRQNGFAVTEENIIACAEYFDHDGRA